MKRILFSLFFILFTIPIFAEIHAPLVTKNIQEKITPDEVLHRLIVGNDRFVNNKQLHVDFLKKIKLSSVSQHPIAIVLSCIDSRVPPEIIFDQNVGNIFVTRVAANVINPDVLAGIEYATKVVGAKVIVVLGHQSCGAIKGACEDVKLGHLTQLFDKVQPAIQAATKSFGKKECDNKQFIDLAVEDNVRHIVAEIPKDSHIVQTLINEGDVKIVGAMYDVRTGKVIFLNNISNK